MKSHLYLLLLLSFSLATPLSAQIDVSGSWSNIEAYGSGVSSPYCSGIFNASQEIRYGASYYDNGYWDSMCYWTNKPGGQSGLGFYGNSNINFACQTPGQTKELYNLGTFTHYNQPIYVPYSTDGVNSESLSGGLLTVSLTGESDSDFDFFVDFEETPNNPNNYPVARWDTSTCPYGENNGSCNDRISVEDRIDPGNEIIIDGESCQVVLEGFGDCSTGVSSDVVEFITTEGSTNSACLWASMTTPEDLNGTVGDFVWSDLNADGIQTPSEPGITGIVLDLYVSVDNQSYSFAETTTTGSNGKYSFDSINPDLWYKVFIDPANIPNGGAITARKQGSKSGKDSNAYQTGFTNRFSVNESKFKKSIDIGIVPISVMVSLSGQAWIDRSGDGTLESAAEQAAPVDGATVKLYKDENGDGVKDGGALQTTTTQGGGLYDFSGLNPSLNYVVELTDIPSALPGFVALNAGSNDAIDSDFDPATGFTASINPEPSIPVVDVDAGLNAGGIVIVIYDNGDAPTVYDIGGEPGHVQNDQLFIGSILGDGVNSPDKFSPRFDMATLSAVVPLDDGISGPAAIPGGSVRGFSLDVTIVSNAWASLSCWVDYDQNNAFDDDEKRDILITGANVYSVPMITTEDIVLGDTYARCRLAYDSSETTAPGGLASSGEVEDFPVFIGEDLPVELSYFEADARDGRVVLSWATASESNNAGFSVQHSTNGRDFDEIEFIEGNGTTNTESNYSSSIDGLDSGIHLFRLKQVDHDGRFEYSRTIEVEMEIPSQVHLSNAYPNPFNPSTTIQFSVHERSNVEIGIYDLTGRLRQTIFSGIQEAGTAREIAIDASKLSSGTYLVRLNAEGIIAQKSITLAK